MAAVIKLDGHYEAESANQINVIRVSRKREKSLHVNATIRRVHEVIIARNLHVRIRFSHKCLHKFLQQFKALSEREENSTNMMHQSVCESLKTLFISFFILVEIENFSN